MSSWIGRPRVASIAIIVAPIGPGMTQSSRCLACGRHGKAPAPPRGTGALAHATAYIRPTTWPSGSANSAIVVSGATSVSGMITRPPEASALARTPFGSSECT